MGWMEVGERGHWHCCNRAKSPGTRPHSNEAFPAIKTPQAIGHAAHKFKAGGEDGKYCDMILDTGSADGDRQLSNSLGQPGFSDEGKLFQALSAVDFALQARLWHKGVWVFTTTEAQAPRVVCGQRTNNSLKPKAFRETGGTFSQKAHVYCSH